MTDCLHLLHIHSVSSRWSAWPGGGLLTPLLCVHTALSPPEL